ncbi:MAG: sigma-70 family RNA polymerase sigma factor [Verrucomicrobiota bacterium]
MEKSEDIHLLRSYAREGSDQAFAELVERHLDQVYSVALRQVRDPHLAEEVAQRVFILLARKAGLVRRHSSLPGWLFRSTRYVASELVRSEGRRRVREEKAMDQLREPANASPWTEIEPLLDEGLDWLEEKDRNILLLRFFQQCSLKEVADRLGIKEDAAQKRVSRSLEKLRAFFAQRGTVVPATGLVTAMSTFAVQAAPVGLSSSVLTAVAGSAGSLTVATFITGSLEFMTTTQKIFIATSAVIAVMTVPYGLQWQAARTLRQENATLRLANKQLAAIRQGLENEALENRARLQQLQREAVELPKLRGEINALRRQAAASAGHAQPGNASSPGADDDDGVSKNPMARMDRGRQLHQQGRHAEALKELLWCFDKGGKDPAFVGVRLSFLLNEIAELGKEYPPALEALTARRDTVEKAVIDGSGSAAATLECAALNKSIGDADRNLALFDHLPQNSPARANLVKGAVDQFLAAKRYKDIAEQSDPEAAFLQRVAFAVGAESKSPKEGQPTSPPPAVVTHLILEAGANSVEVLAGIGEVDRAKTLADKVLAAASVPDALPALIERAERAGSPEVAAYLRGKQSPEK